MRSLSADTPNPRADLLVHLGLGVSVIASLILAVGAMLNFGSNMDTIAVRLSVPPPGASTDTLVGEAPAPTNLAVGHLPILVPETAVPTNAEPATARPAPNQTAG